MRLNIYLQHINKNMNVFEWGSGISTFWFAKHAKQINTVEHNYYWYSKMINQIDKLKINNIDIVIKPEQNKGEDIDWNKYISSIKDSSNEKDLFDIIVIDGRKRVKCFDICKEYLKKDGIIIFDDSYRKKYNSIYDSNLQYIDYDFGYHRTTVFRNRK